MSQLSSHKRTLRMVQIALFAAIIVVLQLLSVELGVLIPILPFAISLVNIPIVLGGVFFGKKAGAFLGGVFGAIVTIATVTGFDKGALPMFQARPVITVFLCFFKGIVAGFFAAWIYEMLSKKVSVGKSVLISAIIAPTTNTFLFSVFVFLFYPETLNALAGGTNVLLGYITSVVIINYLFELITTVIISPVLANNLKHKLK